MKNTVSRLIVTGLLAGSLFLQYGGTGRAQTGTLSFIYNDRSPTWSPTGERIAFVSDRDAKPEIYIVNADGRDLRRLTTSPPGTNSSSPAWSPDGRIIAFVFGLGGDSQVFVMNADGSGQRLLVSGRSWGPAWSPDGRKIAFISEETSGVSVVAAEGGQQVNISSGALMGRDTLVDAVSWSPDGKRLAFATWETNASTAPANEGSATDSVSFNGVTVYFSSPTRRFYIVDADGRHPRTLANTVVTRSSTVLSYGPAWSPDGIRVAFVSALHGSAQIHTMKPDGSDRVQLTFQGSNYDPVWSPDGRRIAFVSDRQEEYQVFVMNADGSGQLRLTGSGEGRWPTWSPDGQRIVYASKPPVQQEMLAVEREAADKWRLFSVKVDGTGETQLTEGR